MEYNIRVKMIREYFGKNQSEFGEVFGLSTMQVSHIEAGNREIKIELLNKMDDFGVNTHWLITVFKDMPKPFIQSKDSLIDVLYVNIY